MLTEQQIREIIREELGSFMKSERFVFEKNIQIMDGRFIQVGTTNGLRIGTATTQKLGFYNKLPVVQAGAISAPATQGGTYNQSDVQSIVTAVNSIRTALTNLGLTA